MLLWQRVLTEATEAVEAIEAICRNFLYVKKTFCGKVLLVQLASLASLNLH
jgi:hypothetical protein|tara:strand:- start:76 stop:228 length:153 start_codon:yes stop_codon:yes gene_type:complete